MPKPQPKGPVRRANADALGAMSLTKVVGKDPTVSGIHLVAPTAEPAAAVAAPAPATPPSAPSSDTSPEVPAGDPQAQLRPVSEVEQPAPQAEKPARTRKRAAAAKATPPPKPPTTKITFVMLEEDAHRAKSAWAHLPVEDRPRTWGEFVTGAIMSQVEKIEAEYNDGEPFRRVALTTGRPPKL